MASATGTRLAAFAIILAYTLVGCGLQVTSYTIQAGNSHGNRSDIQILFTDHFNWVSLIC